MIESQSSPESFQQLVERAATGDRAAAARLIGALIDRDRDRQERALAVLRASDSEALWGLLVEYLATARWRGQRLPLPPLSDLWRHKLRHRVLALLTLRHDPVSDAARERALVTALQDRSPWIRAAAADLLAERRATAAGPALMRTLDDSVAVVRIHAARALGRLEHAPAVGPLVDALSHRNDALAGAATDALVRLGPAALPGLVEASRSSDEWVRWHAAHALGRLSVPGAIAPLVDLLGDADATVRWAAVEALQRHGPAAIEPVVQALLTRSVTLSLADGAGHLLRQVREPRLAALLRPLAEHLGDSYAPVSVPTIAGQVLVTLREHGARVALYAEA